MVQDSGRVEIPNANQVVGLDIIAGIQAAPGQQRILDADRHDAPEPCPHRVVVLVFQTATVGVVGDVREMVHVDLIGGAAGNLHQPRPEIRRNAGTIAAFQSVQHGGAVFLPQFPQPRILCALYGTGVAHIKDILQIGLSVVLVN